MQDSAEEIFKELRLGYTESTGSPELRKEIAGLYTNMTPENILVHSGAEEAIFNFMNVLLAPGDHIVVHWPGYQSLFEVAKSIGCQVTKWETHPEEKWELDLHFLKQRLQPNTKVVVVNLPHNPTGYLMSKQTYHELISLSQSHGFLIFSDEVYRHLEYNENDRLPALCDVDQLGVSLGVLSKSFGLAGLRIGWIATQNTALLDQMAAFKDYTTICNSAPSEYLAMLALKSREQILTRNRTIIQENLKILNDFFAAFSDSFKWITPKAGPIAFPELLTSEDANTFCDELVKRAGILLLPGTCYDERYKTHFRIGFGRKNMSECVEKLGSYLKQQGLN
jgi:aspartate/methionine/tyrosine aminotransferase